MTSRSSANAPIIWEVFSPVLATRLRQQPTVFLFVCEKLDFPLID
ncbi:MAG: hypothetical protein AAFX44_01850 [Pseudomonadota bacterium]